jgi:hypothetical protein
VIIDVNEDITAHLHALSAAGVTDVIGYLNPHGQTGKVITPARAKAIAAVPMSLTLVSEGWGDFAHGDISAAAGTRDAQHALAALPALGAPEGAAVYFAVDTDASATQIAKLVMPYFAAIRAVFGGAVAPNGFRTASKYRVGVYASGAVCNAALASDFADFAWLAAPTGWLGSKEFLVSKKWVLHQGLPTHVAGVACDPNAANGTDWGQFIPFSEVQILAPSAQSISEAQAQMAKSVSSASSAARPDIHSASVTIAISAALEHIARAKTILDTISKEN